MLLSGGFRIVVKVIDDETRAVGGEGDVEFEEQAADGRRHCLLGGESEEDIRSEVDELDDLVRREGGTESLQLAGEKQEMRVGGDAVLEERQRGVFGRSVADVESSFFAYC